MNDLPVCPLCGFTAFRENSGSVHCARLNCRLWSGNLTEDQWRRLAAPPIAPEIVAVLQAAREWNRADLASDKTDLPLMSAVDAWLAANTPGLPPEKE